MSTTTITPGPNRVEFRSQGHTLVGTLFTPADFNATSSYPTVVFAGPFNQVKEQTGTVYGRKLADLGYVALSFDHLGYGESGGTLRNNESPAWKMEGIRDATSFLGTLPFVDRSRLFGLGVCAGAGYMTMVATTDKRLQAVATISGMMNNTASYFGLMSREQIVPLIEAANRARQQAYETGNMEYYDALGLESLDLEKLDPKSAQAEGHNFYMTARAGAQTYPRYSHKAPMTLLEGVTLENATALAPYLYTPYLGIYGEKAMKDTGPLTVAFHAEASEPKQLVEVPGASHVSLYDVDEHVNYAIARLDAFFREHTK